MSEILRQEGVGQLVSRASLAIGLAGLAYAFIRIRGSQSPEMLTGGWTELEFNVVVDHQDSCALNQEHTK